MRCSRCGTENNDEYKFCFECGNFLKDELLDKRVMLAINFEREGNIKEAIKQYKIILEINPNNAFAHKFLGYLYYHEGLLTMAEEEYKKAVENIHSNNMIVVGDFMFGFDTDTKDVFDDTLKQIKKLGVDAADFCILTPFPGTPIYNKLEKEKRILTKDWSQYNLKNPVFKPKNMTLEELLIGVRKMYYEYYSIPNNIKRIFKSMRLGFLPFLLVLQRTFAASMSHRKLFF